MAKKASSAIGGASSMSPQSEKPAEKSGTHVIRPSETRQKPSALVDTRVIYCGDNLDQLANPAFSPARRRSHARRNFSKTSMGLAGRSAGNLQMKTNSR
jgi:hypothetical protein